jgi:hypothetical protein
MYQYCFHSSLPINNADGTALHLFQKTIVIVFSTSTAKAHRSISLFFRKEMICKTSLEVAMHGDSECRATGVKEGKNHVRRKFLGGKNIIHGGPSTSHDKKETEC